LGASGIFLAIGALAPLAACGMVDGRSDSHPRLGVTLAGIGEPPSASAGKPSDTLMPQDGPAPRAMKADAEPPVLGAPYMIDGKAYVPAPIASLDEVGYAAVLPDAADGRRTANGEIYAPGAISAAHRTLPLPSYVEVTALDTGRTILVWVNDRGPLLNDRLIALSPGAARQLGLRALDGTAAVRVRKMNPSEQDRVMLRDGGQVAERIETPAGLRVALWRQLPKAPAPLTGPVRTLGVVPVQVVAQQGQPTAPGEPIRKVVPVQHSQPARTEIAGPEMPVPALQVAGPATRRGGYVVQIAALSSHARAEALAKSLGGYVMPAGALYRVRTGPFETEAAARGSLGQVRAKGYAEARLMANDAR